MYSPGIGDTENLMTQRHDHGVLHKKSSFQNYMCAVTLNLNICYLYLFIHNHVEHCVCVCVCVLE